MKKRKLKIAIFHLGFFFSGGGEKLVLEEAAGLIKRGHDVSLFAPVIDKEDCFPDLIKQFKVHSLFFPFSFNFPLRDFIAIAGAVFLTPLTFFRFLKYNVFFGANQPGVLICFFLAKILKKPYVIYLAQPTRLLYPRKIDLMEGFGKGTFNMFFFLTRLFRPLVIFLDRISIQGADKVLVNGEYMAGVIKKVYKVKLIVCPAGAHVVSSVVRKRWTGNVRANSHLIKKPYILISNRHFPQKMFEYAIEAMASIVKISSKTHSVITGNPTEYTEKLKELTKKLKVDKNIIFTGYVTENDMFKLYKNAAVYVYTSPEEDFGMGVIEAMGAEIPVVAWNNAGPSKTIINGKTGYLVKPFSQKKFTEKIIYLLTNQKQNIKMGKIAQKHVSKNYTYKKHIDILENTTLEVVNH